MRRTALTLCWGWCVLAYAGPARALDLLPLLTCRLPLAATAFERHWSAWASLAVADPTDPVWRRDRPLVLEGVCLRQIETWRLEGRLLVTAELCDRSPRALRRLLTAPGQAVTWRAVPGSASHGVVAVADGAQHHAVVYQGSPLWPDVASHRLHFSCVGRRR